jgi:predicted Zn-dependent protease
MGQQGGKKPPQFMSTHPSDETRLSDLKTQIPKVMPLYEQAIASQSM